MDQLDVNLSELRVALVERERARASHMALTTPMHHGDGFNDKSMTFETSTKQLGSTSTKPEPARSWFKRLFGA